MNTYRYEDEKGSLFTENGQVMFLDIRDHIGRLLKEAGAVRMREVISQTAGDSWQRMACVDRMVELGELQEVTGDWVAGQYRVFTR